MSIKKIILITVSVVLLLGAALGVGFFFLIFGTLKNSTPYKMSVEYVMKNATVEQRIGKVLKIGYFPTGSVHVENGTGTASFDLTVTGEKQESKVHTALSSEGNSGWSLDEATILSSNGEAFSIIPLKISSVSFHSGSEDGPVNDANEYVLGETVYWTIAPANLHVRNGKVSVMESLKVVDAKGQVIFEKPEFFQFEDTVDSKTFTIDNNLSVPEAGDYKVICTLKDRYSDREVTQENDIHVKPATSLKADPYKFFMGSYDGAEKSPPVFAVGATIYAKFDLYGYQLSPENTVSIAEDIEVTDDKGNSVIKQDNLLDINMPWNPAEIMTIKNKFDLPGAGNYKIHAVLRDRLAGTTIENLSSVEVK